jgi:hypothetical protein
MAELYSAIEKLHGVSLLERFYPLTVITDYLRQQRLSVLQVDTQRYIKHFSSIPALLRSIKRVGALQNPCPLNPGLQGKHYLQRLSAHYPRVDALGMPYLPLTYDIAFIIARKE